MVSNEELLALAREARANAYAPYSHFVVGAAVRTREGAVVTGCNVENASYGLSLCAERVAFASAVALGHRNFDAIALAGPDGVETTPCGACRQFMAEFGHALSVIYASPAGTQTTTIAQLLPHAFGSFV